MSGVFGVIAPHAPREVTTLANQIGAALSHREWYVTDVHADETRGLALGRVGIGLFNARPQPVWNADHSMALVMAGELYDVDAATEKNEIVKSPETVALAGYQQLGEQFVNRLNGAFIIAIWDAARNQILIANDRFGFYPLYYACRGGRLIFAPEVKGILTDESVPHTLDLAALAQYMRFQRLLGERTFFEEIRLLPPASVLRYDCLDSTCSLKTYWTFDDIAYRPNVTAAEAAEEAGRLLRRAVRRLAGDAYRPGVYLSGGLDSRTILGLIERRPVVTLTYGMRHCRDTHYAQRIAQAVGSQHQWFDLPDGRWVREHADFHLELTEGFHSWLHGHGISTLATARQLIDVQLSGWDGGTVMGHPASIEPLLVSPANDAALLTRIYYLFSQEFTWPSIDEAEERLLYTEPMWPRVRGLAFESFRAELARCLDYRPDVRAEYFFIRNHCGRLTHNMITMYRSHMEVRFPFFDYDLFDFLYSLPAQLRADRNLYRAVIQRETPRLALIPYDHDEFLPTTHRFIRGAHEAATRLRHRFEKRYPTLVHARHTLYADYENYLRHELRDWAEGILYDRRTAERGIFQPSFLRTLMQRHLSGLEEWTVGKIAPLMTYEMMLRRFYD
ncbi:MAG TPA: asparagine synthase-related protein [Anaerolineae bacterium]|nr:asparagine synthase-related protein [Anaerolineae bacterium]